MVAKFCYFVQQKTVYINILLRDVMKITYSQNDGAIICLRMELLALDNKLIKETISCI